MNSAGKKTHREIFGNKENRTVFSMWFSTQVSMMIVVTTTSWEQWRNTTRRAETQKVYIYSKSYVVWWMLGLLRPVLCIPTVFFSEQTGQLNEYTERKEMSADVVCMALGKVPVGEQRCRFLAVGLSDNTVRIISLDPTVSVLWLVKCLSIFWQEKTKSICEILACCCHETRFHYGLR